MFSSRRGRPSLIGRAAHTAARTALITKTATTVAGRSAARQSAGASETAAPAAAPVAAAGLGEDAIARLKQLAELHAAGILTDAEFAEQKARLLA